MLDLKKKRTRALRFFQVDIWYWNESDGAGLKGMMATPLRVAVRTVQGFFADKCALQASALTFYTLLAVVPVLALLFGLAQGFGLDEQLEKLLYQRMAGQQEAIEKMVSFSRDLLHNTRGGVIAGVGVVILFWSAVKVLGRIETVLNQIWKAASRKLIRKFTDYLTIMLIGPLLVIISSSITIYLTAHMTAAAREYALVRAAGPLVMLMLKLLPYVLIWLLFFLIYLVIPNIRVKFFSALIGGLLAGIVFQLVQGGYIFAQVLLSKYNAVYGSFAALPLFLIWMQLSWMIVLFGAQLAHAHQQVGRHPAPVADEKLSFHLRQKYALYIFWNLVRRFMAGDPPPAASALAEKLNLPFSLVDRSIHHLLQCGLVSTVIDDTAQAVGYQPARDINGITVADVLHSLNKAGADDLPEPAGPELVRISTAVDEMADVMKRSSINALVKDL